MQCCDTATSTCMEQSSHSVSLCPHLWNMVKHGETLFSEGHVGSSRGRGQVSPWVVFRTAVSKNLTRLTRLTSEHQSLRVQRHLRSNLSQNWWPTVMAPTALERCVLWTWPCPVPKCRKHLEKRLSSPTFLIGSVKRIWRFCVASPFESRCAGAQVCGERILSSFSEYLWTSLNRYFFDDLVPFHHKPLSGESLLPQSRLQTWDSPSGGLTTGSPPRKGVKCWVTSIQDVSRPVGSVPIAIEAL